ncbi:MAG TPA: hypothetical protein VFL57_07425 [Bryobacteraceae bacterium]|nr:hypothetical protein [Bryobacteraceae bacterium]
MPCLLVVLVLLFPRIAIVVLYLFTNFFGGVYDTVLLPLLGFLFLPVTLLAYTWLVKAQYSVDVFFLIVMIVALAIDLGSLGGGYRRHRSRA